MSETIWIALIAAVPGTLAAAVSWRNTRKIDNLHIAVNSRLTELLTQTAKAAKAEGRAQRASGAD